MRARPVPVTLLVAVVGAVALARPAPAAGRPEIVAEVGHTAAVEGDPGGGGASIAVALLWPLEKRFRFGLMGFADDFGTRAARLVSPGGDDLGPVSDLHRATRGGAWRIEGHLPETGGLRVFGMGTWGFYRVADDLHGALQRCLYAAGGGLGIGILRPVSGPHAAGIVVRYQQLSRGAASRYLSAAAEWRWGWRATE